MPPLDAAGDARRWLAKASDDLRAGNHALTADPPLVEDALFHMGIPTVAEAREALKLAREVYDALLARLPFGARP